MRTSDAEDRHAGLSQVLIDLHAPGVEVNPIPFLDGTADFNEVVLTDVFVPDADVVGTVGNGWAQIGQELAFERGGPDRWLSTYLVLEQYLREHEPAELDAAFVELLGSAAARFWGLRNLSLSVARAIDAHEQPSVQAALVKEMGTRFEQDLLESIRRFADVEPVPDSSSLFERLLANAILTAPVFTIRGGTIEILRSVAAKGSADVSIDRCRRAAVRDRDPRVRRHCDVRGSRAGRSRRLGADHLGCGRRDRPGLGVGAGVRRRIGRHVGRRHRGRAHRWVSRSTAAARRRPACSAVGSSRARGSEVAHGAVTVVPGTKRDDLVLRDGVLHGTAHRVPWARAVDEIVALLDTSDGPMVVRVDPLERAHRRRGEPRR